MREIEKYIEALKKEPELLSQYEIENLLKAPNELSIDTRNTFTTINFAIVGMIAILIALVFLLKNDSLSISQQEYTSYYEYRYASLVQSIQKKPKTSQTQLFLTTNDNDEVPLHLKIYIEPPIEILNKMGFTFTETNIVYEANVASAGYVRLGMVSGRASVSISDSKKDNVETYDFYPLFLSEMDGRQGVRYSFGNESKEKLTDTFFQERRDSLIPIVVEIPGKETKMIFWFLPTEKLFEILDDGNSKYKETEGNFNEENKKRIVIYPNPTKEFISIEINSQEDLTAIELLDLNGQSVDILSPKVTIKNSQVFYDLDIRDLPNGIYLLSMELGENSKVVKRIIKH